MAIEYRFVRAASELWQRAGEEPAPTEASAYPRDPELLALLALRVPCIGLSGLSIAAVTEWLRKRGCNPPRVSERRLRGYQFSSPGGSFLFYDPGDPAAEQRVTLAHEAAHHWLEVVYPREEAIRALGEPVAAVFAGLREPNARERAYCLFHRVPLGLSEHLLERDARRGLVDGAIDAAERDADCLALELLAPEAVAVCVLPDPAPWLDWCAEACQALADAFGLPAAVARLYARRLAPRVGAGPSFRERLQGIT